VTEPMLSLLQLAPEEAGAVRLLSRLQVRHPGVRILTPHYADEPWRAEIREGAVPGEGGTTSAILTASQPAELLGKLEDLFGGPG